MRHPLKEPGLEPVELQSWSSSSIYLRRRPFLFIYFKREDQLRRDVGQVSVPTHPRRKVVGLDVDFQTKIFYTEQTTGESVRAEEEGSSYTPSRNYVCFSENRSGSD